MKKRGFFFAAVAFSFVMLPFACTKDSGEVQDHNGDPTLAKLAPACSYYDKDEAYEKFDELNEQYDCVYMDIYPCGFPNPYSVRYDIYIGERNEDGECVYE